MFEGETCEKFSGCPPGLDQEVCSTLLSVNNIRVSDGFASGIEDAIESTDPRDSDDAGQMGSNYEDKDYQSILLENKLKVNEDVDSSGSDGGAGSGSGSLELVIFR